ncbi:MAG: hypothetical protein ACI4C5_02535 [Lachnospiraceae bacterium]
MPVFKDKYGVVQRPKYRCGDCPFGKLKTTINEELYGREEEYWACERPLNSPEPCLYDVDYADYEAYLEAHPEEKPMVETKFRKFMCDFSGLACAILMMFVGSSVKQILIIMAPFVIYSIYYKIKNRKFLWKTSTLERVFRVFDIFWLILFIRGYVLTLLQFIIS